MWPTGGTRHWLESLLRSTRPDIVLFGAPHPLAFLGPGLDVPYAVLAHGAEVSIGRIIPGYGALMARALRRASVVLAVSHHTARAVRRAAGVPAVVVGAGVDTDRIQPGVPPDELVLACVSRFVPRKGHTMVLEAAELLRRRGLSVRVVLAGEGRLAHRLRKRAESTEVDVDVIEGPSDAGIVEIYRNASIFCMPARSRWFGLEREGLGLVYLEAAAAGLPILAGRSGGAPETIDPGTTGFVVSSIEDIVEAVVRLADPAERGSFGSAARARVEQRHSWRHVAGEIAKILERVS